MSILKKENICWRKWKGRQEQHVENNWSTLNMKNAPNHFIFVRNSNILQDRTYLANQSINSYEAANLVSWMEGLKGEKEYNFCPSMTSPFWKENIRRCQIWTLNIFNIWSYQPKLSSIISLVQCWVFSKVEMQGEGLRYSNVLLKCLCSKSNHGTKVDFAFFNVPVVSISRGGHFWWPLCFNFKNL